MLWRGEHAHRASTPPAGRRTRPRAWAVGIGNFNCAAERGRSVALGLERTGRVVSGAAILIAIVLLSFAASGLTFLKRC